MQRSFCQNEFWWKFAIDRWNSRQCLGYRWGLAVLDRMEWIKSGLHVQVIQHIAAEVDPIGSGITYDEFEAMIVSLPDFASSFSLVFWWASERPSFARFGKLSSRLRQASLSCSLKAWLYIMVGTCLKVYDGFAYSLIWHMYSLHHCSWLL